MSAAFESLGQAVAFLDGELHVVEASPAFRGLVGSADVEGHYVTDFVDLTGVAPRLRAGERCTAQCELTGTATPVAVTAGRLSEGVFDDSIRYAVAVQLRDGGSSRRVSGDEAEEIRRALEQHRWRRSAAARALGISRATLWRRMRDYGLL